MTGFGSCIELAIVLTIALRFVPTLFEEIEKIAKAQRSPERTRLRQLHFTLRDLVAFLIVLGMVLATIGSERLT